MEGVVWRGVKYQVQDNPDQPRQSHLVCQEEREEDEEIWDFSGPGFGPKQYPSTSNYVS